MKRQESFTTCQSKKVVLLGECSTGKTSIVYHFLQKEFVEAMPPTIGAAFHPQTVAVGDKAVKLDIWDTAGQERYHSLAPLYYRDSDAAIVLYDITNKLSFNGAKVWLKEMTKYYNDAKIRGVLVLVGNKVDREDEREVLEKDGRALAENYEVDLFFETSAKTGENVKELFSTLADSFPEDNAQKHYSAFPGGADGQYGFKPRKKGGCC